MISRRNEFGASRLPDSRGRAFWPRWPLAWRRAYGFPIRPPPSNRTLCPRRRSTSNPARILKWRYLRGGCFWGVQGVFQHVKGVTNALSGYSGGEKGTAQYETVSTGSTGHAESVKVTFDPRQVSYGRLLQIYFSVAHDPTELNRQGPDTGTQYRSEIFASNADQAQDRQGLCRPARQGRCIRRPDRHQDRSAEGILSPPRAIIRTF